MSVLKGACRAAGGRCGIRRKYIAFPTTTAIRACTKLFTAGLDTASASGGPPKKFALPAANIVFVMLDLNTSVQYVKGVGPRLADVLGAKGIHTVHDLLYYLPFRYEDRLNPRRVEELQAGEMATVIAEVRNSGLFRTRRMPIFELVAGQGR